MQIGVLGPLEVRDDRGEPVVVAGTRPRTLLVVLALAAGRPVDVDRIVDAQYGLDPPPRAANAVQAHASRLRRVLPAAVEHTGDGYRLVVDPEDVDAHRFERLAAEGRRLLEAGRPEHAAASLRTALELWRGGDVAELPSDAPASARLAELRLSATEDLSAADPVSGPSVAELTQLVAAHPLRERLRAGLVGALHAAGRTAEALAEFDRARRVLRTELGADPGPDLVAAHAAVLRAGRPATARRRPVPAAITTFVGRDAELDRLADLSDGARLVTVLGPGGAGKTRLATTWAGRRAARGRSTCFVELAAVSGPSGPAAAVRAALGVRDTGAAGTDGADDVDGLAAAIGSEDLLLVLDNCEHVLSAVAQLVRRVLGDCPDVRVLATSREPLGLTGEALVPLGSLPLPPEEQGDGAAAPLDYPAVRLFADRAAAVVPGFAVGPDNAADVLAVCAALDGLPLPIELAAARLRHLSLPVLAARLPGVERFGLLSRGDPTAAERHRTLDRVVAWSWDLLDADEQRVARRFAAFAGGADTDAAVAVCGPDAPELLAGLVDRSLVTTDGTRFRMLQTIRLFCAQRLVDAGEDDAVRLAHAGHHLALARTGDEYLRRAEQLDWLARLGAAYPDLTAALRWAGTHDRPTAFGLVAALAAYRWLAGRGTEGGDVAAALLDGPVPPGTEEGYVACVLHAVPQAAPEHWARAADIVGGLGGALSHPFLAALWGMAVGPPGAGQLSPTILGDDPWNRAAQRIVDALLGTVSGGSAGAEQAMTEALTTFRGLGERWGTAQALDGLAMMAGWRGRFADAHARWTESLELLRLLGATADCADVLGHRAECLLREGLLDAAEADLDAAEDLWRSTGRTDPRVETAVGRAELARRRGDPAVARDVLAEALAHRLHPGLPGAAQAVVPLRTALGALAVAAGDRPAAREQYRAAVAAALASPIRSDVADVVEAVAVYCADPATAARLLGAGAGLRGLAVAADPHAAPVVASSRAALGPDGFAAAYHQGTTTPRPSLLTLVEEVLGPLSAP